MKEHRESNPTEMERLRKMLEEKEVELVKRVKEANCLSQRESELQAQLRRANDLLLQWDQELATECQNAEREAQERKEMEDTLQEEIEKLGNAAYASYEQGFDEAFTQVRYFAKGVLIDLSKVDRKKILSEILVIEASGSQGGRATEGNEGTPIGADEEEEEVETLILYPDLS